MKNKRHPVVEEINSQQRLVTTTVRTALRLGSAAILLAIPPTAAAQSPFGPVIEVSRLDGDNGFTVIGISRSDFSGRTVSGAGDVNGDGVDDIIIGAPGGDPGFRASAGESYVVFGGVGVGTGGFVELSDLDSGDGFVINGVDGADGSGFSVSGAGDINGDGIADLIIGANRADPNGVSNAGESYVVFGSSNIGSTGSIELSGLDGDDGFVINGIDVVDNTGVSVSGAGDVNGDGIDDLIVGANTADPNGNSGAGSSFVLFGGGSLGDTGTVELSDLDSSDGFVINGVDGNDESGVSVSGAGDVNGDGLSDLLIGANAADPDGRSRAGEVYVVFGDVSLGSTVNLSFLDGGDGFVINGISPNDNLGESVSDAGDVNGDGFDDLIIGAVQGDPPGGAFGTKLSAGESYVLFGRRNIGSSGTIELSDLDGGNGFVINGAEQGDNSGHSVSSAGDINGDGVDDIVVGATGAAPNGQASGQTYIVFGGSGVGSSGAIELESFGVNDGIIINGDGGQSGFSVHGAGDINADGVDDILIGAPAVEISTGETYVVFGQVTATSFCNGLPVTVFIGNGDTPTSQSEVILGTSGNDVINGQGGDDTICGLAGNDTINSGNGNDWVDAGLGNDTVLGGNGNDEIYGDSGVDIINGGPGDDELYGEAGGDFINGNSGDDLLDGGFGVDQLRGGSGDDVINTGSGGNLGSGLVVTGGAGNDIMTGGSGADEIRGETGNDTILGGDANDSLFGGGGNDVVNGQDGNDLLRGNGSRDTVLGGDGNDDMDGGDSDDIMSGGNGNDVMRGATGNDEMSGGAGNDVMSGGGGNDVINGNRGEDELSGGGSNDTLNGGSDTDSCDGNGGIDTVVSCES